MIGTLTVLLGCSACGSTCPVEVPVVWGGCVEHDRPLLAETELVEAWRESHLQPWAVAP